MTFLKPHFAYDYLFKETIPFENNNPFFWVTIFDLNKQPYVKCMYHPLRSPHYIRGSQFCTLLQKSDMILKSLKTTTTSFQEESFSFDCDSQHGIHVIVSEFEQIPYVKICYSANECPLTLDKSKFCTLIQYKNKIQETLQKCEDVIFYETNKDLEINYWKLHLGNKINAIVNKKKMAKRHNLKKKKKKNLNKERWINA